MHLFIDLVDRGFLVYRYVLYISVYKPCVYISSLPQRCLYECGSFRSHKNHQHFSFSELKSCLSSSVRVSCAFPSPSCLFRTKCQVFLHVSLSRCFCFVQTLSSLFWMPVSRLSSVFPTVVFHKLGFTILPDFSFCIGAALSEEWECLMLIPFCSV